eukprot:5782787-Pyramimonas_sp.AAC.1
MLRDSVDGPEDALCLLCVSLPRSHPRVVVRQVGGRLVHRGLALGAHVEGCGRGRIWRARCSVRRARRLP